MTFLRPTAILLLSLLAISAGPQDATPTPKPAPDAPKDDAAKRAAVHKKNVTAERGLDFKKDVAVGVYSKDELGTFIRREIDREMTREEVSDDGRVLKHFGLIPDSLDWYEAQISLMTGAIGGFYHQQTKQLRLIELSDDMKLDEQSGQFFRENVTMEDITMVHELVHAAQDQHYDLLTVPMDQEENDDVVQALKGLIEGDATVASMKWALREEFFEQVMTFFNQTYKQAQLPGEAAKLPDYLRKSAVFGYGYGAEFVQALIENSNGTWEGVDKAYGDLPASSEQILHPKKYYGAQRDHPQELRIKDAETLAGEGWKLLRTNVHGEFGIYLLLGEFKAAPGLKEAAAGWDGDRFYAYDKGGAISSVWASTWDSEQDAREFQEAVTALLKAKHEGAKTFTGQDGTLFEWKDGRSAVERRGRDVVVIDGPNAGLAGRGAEILGLLTKTEVRKLERFVLTFACPKHPANRSHKASKCWDCDTEMTKQ